MANFRTYFVTGHPGITDMTHVEIPKEEAGGLGQEQGHYYFLHKGDIPPGSRPRGPFKNREEVLNHAAKTIGGARETMMQGRDESRKEQATLNKKLRQVKSPFSAEYNNVYNDILKFHRRRGPLILDASKDDRSKW